MIEQFADGAGLLTPSQGEEVKTITLKMPYHINHVHLYLAECADGLMLFDTGPPLDDAKRCLRENVDFSRLKYVFITHGHIDHCGLAGWLQEETDAKIVMSRGTAAQLAGKRSHIDKLSSVLTTLGFSDRSALLLAERVSQINQMAPLPRQYLLAEESAELLHDLGIDTLSCPWHSQGDLVYLLGNHAFLGDVAIRGIFSVPLLDVDCIEPQSSRFDNYGAFCTSIEKLMQLQGKTLLPSHNDYLADLDRWVCFVVNKVLSRAQRLHPFYQQQDNVYLAVRQFFGSPKDDPLLTYLKTSEIAFIYDFFKQPERLQEVLLCHDLFHHAEKQFSSFCLPTSNK